MLEIAQKLNCNKDTVTAAIQHWYSSRGLVAADGRTRRKSLEHKSREANHASNGDGDPNASVHGD
jgi:hypothetical protein